MGIISRILCDHKYRTLRTEPMSVSGLFVLKEYKICILCKHEKTVLN